MFYEAPTVYVPFSAAHIHSLNLQSAIEVGMAKCRNVLCSLNVAS